MEGKLLQITAGRGPVECQWVVSKVLKAMLSEAATNGLKAQVAWREKGMEKGTLLSAVIEVKGEGLSDFIASWQGTIQWVGRSPYRKFHKRKNWFVGVDLVKQDNKLTVNEQELKFQAIRSGGPGGQHVNKVSTAIRATHIPSGISVVAADSRSQMQNKKQAKTRLLELLKEKKLEAVNEQIQQNWQQHNELERGNPIRVFTAPVFNEQGR